MNKLEKELAMKKASKLILFASVVLCALALFISCQADLVTPVAYTRFDITGSQKVFYDSAMYGSKDITVYYNSVENPFITLDFNRTLGADFHSYDYAYILVDCKYRPIEMSATVYKSFDGYSPDKDFYLNDTKLNKSDTHDYGTFVVYTFSNVDLIRTNTNNTLHENQVNVLEYR